MAKARIAIPERTRTLVLREFNYRCALCGSDRPQMHHLDQDPSNNEQLNLLPLCPNCHLSDQHNPTESIPTGILALFRRFKDPVILSPQFRPLYQRFQFLFEITDTSDQEQLGAAAAELAAFVRALEMGDFYGSKIEALTKQIRLTSGSASLYTGQPSPETARALAALPERNRRQLIENREEVLKLCIELLRYQRWSPPSRGRTNGT